MPELDDVLSQLKPEEPPGGIDFANYKEASEFPPPVARGTYTLVQGKPDFEVDGEHLRAVMNHKIAGGEYDGRLIMFDRVSTKTFEREGSKASSAADHWKAMGDRLQPNNRREWGEFFMRSEGKPFQAKIDIEASCADCAKAFQSENEGKGLGRTLTKEQRNKITYRGEGSFPINPNGGRNFNVKCRECGAELQARNRIAMRIPATNAGPVGFAGGGPTAPTNAYA